MDRRLQFELKQAILGALPHLRALEDRSFETYLVWHKLSEGAWSSRYQQKPTFSRVFAAAYSLLGEIGASFTQQFFETYPEYQGMVGATGLTSSNIGDQPDSLFKAAIKRVWERYGTFNISESEVNVVVEDVAYFVDQPTIRYCFQATLLNFSMAEPILRLSDSLVIRRLDEREISALYDISLATLHTNPHESPGMQEFIIEGEDETPKVFGDSKIKVDAVNPINRAIFLLDKTILCLRILKGGAVGYSCFRFQPMGFCPFSFSTYGNPDPYRTYGKYILNKNELDQVGKYANFILKTSDPAMEIACSRLADAEMRTRPQDRIIDAVIGMEAILLAGLGAEDRRGELKYRFSLNYSTLFNSPEDRHSAFRLAKNLYDLRSKIAHGSSLTKDDFRVGEERLNLSDASKRATETLRKIIQHFLPEIEAAPYKRSDFWELAYFNPQRGRA